MSTCGVSKFVESLTYVTLWWLYAALIMHSQEVVGQKPLQSLANNRIRIKPLPGTPQNYCLLMIAFAPPRSFMMCAGNHGLFCSLYSLDFVLIQGFPHSKFIRVIFQNDSKPVSIQVRVCNNMDGFRLSASILPHAAEKDILLDPPGLWKELRDSSASLAHDQTVRYGTYQCLYAMGWLTKCPIPGQTLPPRQT